MKYFKKLLKGRYILLIILIFAIFLRIVFFCGFGLGDDPYYGITSKLFMESGYKNINLEFGSNYRFGLWIPISFFFRILGVNKVSFVLFPFISSLGLIVVGYFIGKEIGNEKIGLMAAFLLAICPFDATFASTMTIDIPADFLLSLSFLLFIKGNKPREKNFFVYYLIASICLIWAYFIKLPSMFIVFVFALISLIEIKNFRRQLVFYLVLSLLILTSFTIDYTLTGDFLHYFHQEMKYAPKAGLYDSLKSWYFNWMFSRDMSFNILLFGYIFYLGAFGLLYSLVKNIKRTYPLVIWMITIFFFLNFLPMSINPYSVPPRFFRYAHALLLPVVMLFAISMDSIWRFSITKFKKSTNTVLTIFAILFIFITYTSLEEGFKLARLYQDAFSDSEEATFYIAKLGPKPIYSDNGFLDKFNFYTGYEKSYQLMWSLDGIWFQKDIVESKNYQPLKNISDAYIVSDGARAPDCSPYSILNLDSFDKPNNWALLKTIERKLTDYRAKNLKIYYIPKSE
jgi:4-amino-4-deoxy-L-arabinose transferase-like glycosyltransferase